MLPTSTILVLLQAHRQALGKALLSTHGMLKLQTGIR